MANNTSHPMDLNFGDHLHHLPVLIAVLFIGVTVSTFNIITITIILRSNKLRRPFNYPIINILFAATLQSFFTVPAYAFKRLDKNIPHHRESWICNVYRFPYFLCGDILRLSFMLVSFDRLLAVKCAYIYKDFLTKHAYVVMISIIWVLVAVVDTIPFFPLGKSVDKEQCSYLIEHMWGISVTIAFNIVPFIVTIVNFAMLWRIASKITKEQLVRNQLFRNSNIARDKYERLDRYALQKLLDLEISKRRYDAKGNSVFNRKKSYLYAMRGAKDNDLNIPDVQIELSIPESIDDRECTPCYPLTEKILMILEMRATKTSVLLLMVYMVCWTPLGIYQFIENICSTWISGIKHEHAYIDQFVLKVLSLFSSIFLPLVYCWKTKLFRKEAHKLSSTIQTTIRERFNI